MSTIWTAGSNGTGNRRWFVWRNLGAAQHDMEVLSDAQGNYRRFVTPEAARRVAAALNGAAA